MTRVLFTGVGRRVELLQAFREAALHMSVDLKIYGADMDMTAPALAWCDAKRQVCAIRDDAYIPQLLNMCREDEIDLVIPTIDTDLMKLAEARTEFETQGTKVFIADPDKVALCRDKRLTGTFFESCDLLAPKTCDDWERYDGPFPCFIKPKDGSSSIDAYRVEGTAQLQAYATKVSDYIVQPFVEGREYTIDVFCGYDGALLSAIPRERVAVRAGEVLKTRVAMDQKMIAEARFIAERFRPRGPMTVQLIRDEMGQDWFIEINPRYGGGAPLSMKAGARTAELALAIAAGESAVPIAVATVSDGVAFSRFDQSVRTDSAADLSNVEGIIFDLDDTLYLERDYVRSGFEAVARHLGDKNVADELWSCFLDGKPAIDAYVERHGCVGRKAEMLEVYRGHRPNIALAPEVRDTLCELRSRGFRLGIITDGRPEGQRAKLDALGLCDLVDDVIITDELGGPQFRKPCDIAFRVMQRKWGLPFERMCYVGDNPAKDFHAPKQLGIQYVLLTNNDGLYVCKGTDAHSISSITEVTTLLK